MDEGDWNENPADFAAEWAASDRKNEVIYEIENRRGKFRLTTDALEALQADLAAAEQRGYLRGLEESAGVREALEKSAKHCPQCDGVGSYDFGPPRNKNKVPCEFCEIARNALKDKQP